MSFPLAGRRHFLDTLSSLLLDDALIFVLQVELLPHAQLARSAAKKFFGEGEKG